MSLQEATEILKHHQKWRRGAEIEQIEPKKLGIAIDVILEKLTKLLNE